MITVSEIREKSERKYIDFLKYKIKRYLNCETDNIETFFPLYIKADKGKSNENLLKYEQEIAPLIAKSKNKTDNSYTLEFEEINTRNFGHQQKLKNIFFESEEDYISFIKKKHEVNNLIQALDILKIELFLSEDELCNWALIHTQNLVLAHSEEIDFWHNICLCANWLHENPKSGLYIREIPLTVHTKFMETYKSLIHSFFANDNTTNFEEKHGLKQKEYLVRFRTLDEHPLHFQKLSISELSLPLQDFCHLDESECLKNIKRILIVENEMVYLTFPKIQGTFCVWGHGFTVTMLKNCEWLHTYKIIYFGDLDEHGFQILSDFRIYFPDTESFCMDMKTLQEFSIFRCKGKVLSGNSTPQNLSEAELTVFNELRNNSEKNRLEQERICLSYIQRKLHNL